jgi:hypothetical protein
LIINFDRPKNLLMVGCSQKGVCPPLYGFPAFAKIMKDKPPSRVTAVFFEPPLGAGNISVFATQIDSDTR